MMDLNQFKKIVAGGATDEERQTAQNAKMEAAFETWKKEPMTALGIRMIVRDVSETEPRAAELLSAMLYTAFAEGAGFGAKSFMIYTMEAMNKLHLLRAGGSDDAPKSTEIN